MQDNGADTHSSRPFLAYGSGILLAVLNTLTGLFGIAMLVWAVIGLHETGERWGLVGVMLLGGGALALGIVVLIPATLLFFFASRQRISRYFRRCVLILAALAILTNGSALACIFGSFAWETWTKQRANPLHATGLEHSIRTGDVALTRKILTSHPALIHERDFYGNTPLMLAVKQGDPAMVKTLLSCGADPNETGWAGLPFLLHFAVQKGNVEIAGLLLDGGADVNRGDEQHRTPLAYAIERHDAALIALLKERGGVTEDLSKMAWEAAYFGRVDQMRELVAKGLDVRAHSDLLHTAAGSGNIEMANFLLDHGADIAYTVPHNGFNALHEAAMQGKTEMCRFLISRGVPKDGRIWNGQSALGLAKERGYLETARVLIELGVPE